MFQGVPEYMWIENLVDEWSPKECVPYTRSWFAFSSMIPNESSTDNNCIHLFHSQKNIAQFKCEIACSDLPDKLQQ